MLDELNIQVARQKLQVWKLEQHTVAPKVLTQVLYNTPSKSETLNHVLKSVCVVDEYLKTIILRVI